jgi:two-component system chemotaxis response regulator CheY
VRVLVADDDAIARLILQKAVVGLGHECEAAQDGVEAWTLFHEWQPEVIISDWMMPGMDGIELCRRVRDYGQETSTYTYFIVVTALAERSHFLTAMTEGADDYLMKPLDRLDLQVRLNVGARVMSLYRQLETRKAELEVLSDRYYDEARHDPLTGLGNRLRLREDLETLDGRMSRYGHTYAVALCDVDHFKAYNDRYGHQAGDEALRAVARALGTYGRLGDAAYRYGGEEFVVVMPEQDLSVQRHQRPSDCVRLWKIWVCRMRRARTGRS